MPRNPRPDQIRMGGRMLSVQVAGSPRNTHDVGLGLEAAVAPDTRADAGHSEADGLGYSRAGFLNSVTP